MNAPQKRWYFTKCWTMPNLWEFQIRNMTVGRSSNWESSSIWEVLWAFKNLQKDRMCQADALTHFYFLLTTRKYGSMSYWFLRISSEQWLEVSIYTGHFFQVFVYLWPIIWFLFLHLTCPRILLNMCAQLLPKWIPGQRLMGFPGITSLGAMLSPFWPLGDMPMCSVALAPRTENMWPLDLLPTQGLPLSVLAIAFVFKRQNLTIYPVSVVISNLKCKQEPGAKYLALSATASFLRKCKQEASCECLAWSTSIKTKEIYDHTDIFLSHL